MWSLGFGSFGDSALLGIYPKETGGTQGYGLEPHSVRLTADAKLPLHRCVRNDVGRQPVPQVHFQLL